MFTFFQFALSVKYIKLVLTAQFVAVLFIAHITSHFETCIVLYRNALALHNTISTAIVQSQQEIIPASLAPAFPTTVPPANDVAGMIPVDVTRPGTAAPGCAAK